MKCAYLGLPQGALTLALQGHNLHLVGLSCAKPQGMVTHLRHLLATNCPVLLRPDLNDDLTQRLLASTDAQLLVCYLWDRLIPESVIGLFPSGGINYHPSLLPRHRGPDPYFWTLYRGDTMAGVTIHRLDAGFDTGPIIAQRQMPISQSMSAGELAAQLDPCGLELLIEVIDRAESSGLEALAGKPQDERAATEAPAPNDDLLELDWHQPAEKLLCLIRAAAPHPGAYMFLPGSDEILVVLDACKTTLPHQGVLEPGDAVRLEAGVTIWTLHDGLVLKSVQHRDDTVLEDADAIAQLFPNLPDLRSH